MACVIWPAFGESLAHRKLWVRINFALELGEEKFLCAIKVSLLKPYPFALCSACIFIGAGCV